MDSLYTILEFYSKDADPSNLTTEFTMAKSYHEVYPHEKWTLLEAKAFMYSTNKFVFPLGIVYIVFLYLGPKFMENREPFKLKIPLIIWNFFLSGLSFYGLYRSGIDYVNIWRRGGHYEALCLK